VNRVSAILQRPSRRQAHGQISVPDPANLDVLMLAAGACYEDSTNGDFGCAQGWAFACRAER
jgi:hypothetical protein